MHFCREFFLSIGANLNCCDLSSPEQYGGRQTRLPWPGCYLEQAKQWGWRGLRRGGGGRGAPTSPQSWSPPSPSPPSSPCWGKRPECDWSLPRGKLQWLFLKKTSFLFNFQPDTDFCSLIFVDLSNFKNAFTFMAWFPCLLKLWIARCTTYKILIMQQTNDELIKMIAKNRCCLPLTPIESAQTQLQVDGVSHIVFCHFWSPVDITQFLWFFIRPHGSYNFISRFIINFTTTMICSWTYFFINIITITITIIIIIIIMIRDFCAKVGVV